MRDEEPGGDQRADPGQRSKIRQAAFPKRAATQCAELIADGAGLVWVNSDADKIAAAQAAIAAEPAPAPLGREPAPVVVVDDGPLVLVETRKDLSQFKLPFEA